MKRPLVAVFSHIRSHTLAVIEREIKGSLEKEGASYHVYSNQTDKIRTG